MTIPNHIYVMFYFPKGEKSIFIDVQYLTQITSSNVFNQRCENDRDTKMVTPYFELLFSYLYKTYSTVCSVGAA